MACGYVNKQAEAVNLMRTERAPVAEGQHPRVSPAAVFPHGLPPQRSFS